MSVRPALDPDEFNASRTNELARRVLTERQYEIWVRTFRDHWEGWRIAQFLRVHRDTVVTDLAAAKRRLAEEIEHDGKEDNPFQITIDLGNEVKREEDATPTEVARRLERAQRRRGRIPIRTGRIGPAEKISR